MNIKGNIAIIILAAMLMVVLLVLSLYAQQQLIYKALPKPENDPDFSETVDSTIPGTEDTWEAVETENTEPIDDPTETESTGNGEGTGTTVAPATHPQETMPGPTEPKENTPKPTDSPVTDPPSTGPEETTVPPTEPPTEPDPTEDSGGREDEFPLLPVG